MGDSSSRLLSFAYSLENWIEQEQNQLWKKQEDILAKCNADEARFVINKSYSSHPPFNPIVYRLEISKSKFVLSLRNKGEYESMDVHTVTQPISYSQFQDILNVIIEENFIFYQSEYLNPQLIGGPPSVSMSLDCGSLKKDVYFHDSHQSDVPIGLFRLKQKIIDQLKLKKRFEAIEEYAIK